ncbi:MAG: type III-A CRISPR-associated RAMP protein Csm4 [Chloroflexota bacterium]
MNLETYRLTGSYFHFGEQGLGQEETRAFWSSDSLFAALAARLAILQGGQVVDDWVQPFLSGSPPFLLTSLFPFAGDVHFFPVPLAAQLPDGRPLPAGVRPKALKKAQFISESIYRQLLTGKSLVDIEPQSKKIQGDKVWMTKSEHASLTKQLGAGFKPWHIEKRPRVTVERPSNASTLFHVGAVYFAPGCGLWFGIQWLDSAADQALFASLLADLGEAGLGAERSVGYGKAEITQARSLTLPDPGGLWTSLSRYLPRQEEMTAFQHQRAAWKVNTVGGWLDSPQKRGQRRRALNMVQEGAVFGAPAGCILPFGRLEDAGPRYKGEEIPFPHPVYRCGLTVAVGYGGDA